MVGLRQKGPKTVFIRYRVKNRMVTDVTEQKIGLDGRVYPFNRLRVF